MKGSNRLIVAMLVLVVLAGAFWMLLISPKREEASKLDAKVEKLEVQLSGHQAEVETAKAAKREFPANYSQLVVLGKAVPADSETASLLVQIQHLTERSHMRFEEISLNSEEGEAATAAAPEASEAGGSTESVSPTEVAVSTTPLGAAVGPAGLNVMPYKLEFNTDFSNIAGFIHGLDKLVKTNGSKLVVNGRLLTIDAFSLTAPQDGSFPKLQGTFAVTTFLTPPEQGLTGGATPGGPAPTATATPAASTIGGTP